MYYGTFFYKVKEHDLQFFKRKIMMLFYIYFFFRFFAQKITINFFNLRWYRYTIFFPYL